MSYFTYIIQCSDGSYYTGFTDDLDGRIREHDNGTYPNAYTRKRRPVVLVFHYRFPDARSAKEFERQIKGWRRAKKEALIRGDWEILPQLSKRYKSQIKK